MAWVAKNSVAGVFIREFRYFLSTRVMLGVKRLQALACDMRIDLRGRDVGVAEKELDHPQVGAMVDEMRRKGVPQHVRRELLARNRAAAIAADEMPERLARHAGAARGDEQSITGFFP